MRGPHQRPLQQVWHLTLPYFTVILHLQFGKNFSNIMPVASLALHSDGHLLALAGTQPALQHFTPCDSQHLLPVHPICDCNESQQETVDELKSVGFVYMCLCVMQYCQVLGLKQPANQVKKARLSPQVPQAEARSLPMS